MATQTRIAQHTAAIDLMREFTELLKPEAILIAHKVEREQSALTALELKKTEEAREFIKKHGDLLSDLNKRENLLSVAQSNHSAYESETAKKLEKENCRLSDLATSLSVKENELSAASNLHSVEVAKLVARGKEAIIQCGARERALDSKDVELNAKEMRLDEYTASLVTREAKLKEKEARLKDIFG